MTLLALRTDDGMNQTNQASFGRSVKEPVKDKEYVPAEGSSRTGFSSLYSFGYNAPFQCVFPTVNDLSAWHSRTVIHYMPQSPNRTNTEWSRIEENFPKEQPINQRKKHQIDQWAEFQTAYALCEAKLMSFVELPEDWDGNGAVKPNPKHVYRLRRWMKDFNARLIRSPSPMITATGEMALYWRNDRAYAELGIDEIGKPYVLCKENGRISIGLDECASDGEALETILGFVAPRFRGDPLL